MDALSTNVTAGSEEGAFAFYTMSGGTLAERVRIKGGNVGIGTASPASKLHLAQNAGDNPFIHDGTSAGAGSEPYTYYRKSRGTLASPTAVSAGDYIGDLWFAAYNDAFRDAAYISAQVDTGVGATGADMPGRLTFATTPDGSATPQERMRIDSAGNVGIGTATPAQKLHIAGGSGSAYVVVDKPNETTTEAGLMFKTGGVDKWYLWTDNDNPGDLQIEATGLTRETDATPRIRLPDENKDILLAMSGGNVGIGTASPSALLHLARTGGDNAIRYHAASSGAGSEAYLDVRKSRGTVAAPTAVVSGDGLGGVATAGYDGTNFIYATEIYGQVDGTPGANDMPGRLVFLTTADGAAAGTERMRITSAGNVGIGTASPSQLLEVNGAIKVSGISDVKAAYGRAYRTTDFSFAAAGTWYDLELDGGNSNLKNVSHSTTTTPDRITVTYAGTYRITYMVRYKWPTAGTGGYARLRVNTEEGAAGGEIAGSFGQTSTAGANYTTQLTHEVLVSLAANDFVTLQVGGSNAGGLVSYYDDANIADPTTWTTAYLLIEKIDE